MAYDQKPRSPFMKTGYGIPAPLLQKETGEEVLAAIEKAKKIVSKRKIPKGDESNELGAATDSILASNPRNAHLFSKIEKERMGNKAAENTRKINNASTTVERGTVYNSRIGNTDTYTRKPVKPKPVTKQMKPKKAPTKMKSC